MDSKNGEKKSSVIDSLGAVLLFACSMTLLLSFGFICFKSCCNEHRSEVVSIQVKADSIGNLSEESKKAMAELVKVMNSTNDSLYIKYRQLLRKKENEETYMTLGGVFLTVIISIFGFFGYRSFKSLEDRAEIVAKDKTNERVELGIVQMRKDVKTIALQEVNIWGDGKFEELQELINQKFSEDVAPSINEMKDLKNEVASLKEDIEFFEAERHVPMSEEEILQTIARNQRNPSKIKKRAVPFAKKEKEGDEK